MSNVAGSWNVGRAAGRCAACGAELAPGASCWAALCDRPPEPRAPEHAMKVKKGEEAAVVSPFVRLDFCEVCWGQGRRPENLAGGVGDLAEGAGGSTPLSMFSFWRTTVPTPQHKKKLLVDDSVLVDVFQRMEGKSEPQEVRFRFVLALILMRKRLLKYEGEERGKPEASSQKSEEKAAEIWRMVPRGQEGAVLVVNPHLTAEQITEVSQQLSAILAEEV